MKKPRPIWRLVLSDLLMVCLILITFCYFQHGSSWLKVKLTDLTTVPVKRASSITKFSSADTNSVLASEFTSAAERKTAAQAEEDLPETEPDPEPEPDNRTEWQIRFADHFTDEIVQTASSYSSPDVSITINNVVIGEGYSACRYYVADIYVSSIECFRTFLADNRYELYRTEPILEMDADSNALLAMTGDFYSYQYSGIMVRNGITFRSDYSAADICVLYKDGTMETLHPDDYRRSELLEEDIWQLWNFGPALLDEDGNVPRYYNVSETVSYINPRSSVGYYEPGHYCFIVVDGRLDNWSVGMTLPELSQVYYELGCKAAYNLDGGGSAVMTFNDDIYSRQSNGGDRELGDILLIAEPSTYDPSTFATSTDE